MGFNNPSQTSESTGGNKGLKLEKKNLEEKIADLGIRHEKTANNLKEIELRKSKIKDNKALLERLEKKKNELKLTLAGLETKIKDYEEKLSELEKQHSDKVAALGLEKLKIKIDLDNELKDIRTEIDIASKKLSAIDIKKNKSEEEKNISLEKIKELKGEIAILVENLGKLEELTKDLPIKEKERDDLNESIAALKILETFLKKKTKNFHEEMVTINNRVAKEKEKAEKFIKESKGIREKFDKEMEIQKAKADERDGSISQREDWLEDKTKKLRSAKAALEKHYNRKLNHIII